MELHGDLENDIQAAGRLYEEEQLGELKLAKGDIAETEARLDKRRLEKFVHGQGG